MGDNRGSLDLVRVEGRVPFITLPTPAAEDVLDEALADLREEYLDSMPERIAELRGALGRCTEDVAAREIVRRGAHRIAGTAATVGLGAMGGVGRAMELYAVHAAWTPEDVKRLERAVDLVEECARRGIQKQPTSGIENDPRYRAISGASK